MRSLSLVTDRGRFLTPKRAPFAFCFADEPEVSFTLELSSTAHSTRLTRCYDASSTRQ